MINYFLKALLILSFFLLVIPSAFSCDASRVAEDSLLLQACDKDPKLCHLLLGRHGGSPYKLTTVRNASVRPAQGDRSGEILLPNQLVHFKTPSGQSSYGLYFANLFHKDSSQVGHNSINIKRYNIVRDFDGEINVYDASEMSELRSVSPLEQAYVQQMSLLTQSGVSVGYKLMLAGQEAIVSEVEGRILDKSGQYIYVRIEDKLIKKPLSQFYGAIANRLPSTVIAQARTVVRAGGKAAGILKASPIVSVLEASLSPSMASCATLDTMFIKNLCSDNKRDFHKWFKELDVYDRSQLLEDRSYCEIIRSRVQEKIDELKESIHRSRRDFNSIWDPKNIQCGSNKATSFTMSESLLPGGNRVTRGNSQIYHRYVIDKVCSRENSRRTCFDRVSMETWHKTYKTHPFMETQQITLMDQESRGIVHSTGAPVELHHGTRVVQNKVVSDRDPKLRWMVDEILNQCRNQSGLPPIDNAFPETDR